MLPTHCPGLPLSETSPTDLDLQEDVEAFIGAVTSQHEEKDLEDYRVEQEKDPVCLRVMQICTSEWPSKKELHTDLIPYWKVRNHLSVYSGILLYDDRIVVPSKLRASVLQRLHEGHQGKERCRARLRVSVWWPKANQQLSDLVDQCDECAKVATKRREPLLSTRLPQYPWQSIATDLFELNKRTYVVVVDYYSRFPEVIELKSTTSTAVITALKSVFSRYGIPETIRSDNGPQYASREFATFATTYGFQHIKSSPHFPQSNGLAERTVQTVKSLLKAATDPYLALLSYRATPLLWCNLSPSELLMGRRLRTTVPQVRQNLTPQWPHLSGFHEADKVFKEKQKRSYDVRYHVKDQPDIPSDTEVWITTDAEPIRGRVLSPADTPRSYNVETSSGVVRRNRSQLNIVPNIDSDNSQAKQPETETPPRRILTRSQTGVTIQPPNYLSH